MGNAAKRGVADDVGGGWSPIFFSKLPCKRLSSAFWTVGSFNKGDGVHVVEVVIAAALDAIVDTANKKKKKEKNNCRKCFDKIEIYKTQLQNYSNDNYLSYNQSKIRSLQIKNHW